MKLDSSPKAVILTALPLQYAAIQAYLKDLREGTGTGEHL